MVRWYTCFISAEADETFLACFGSRRITMDCRTLQVQSSGILFQALHIVGALALFLTREDKESLDSLL